MTLHLRRAVMAGLLGVALVSAADLRAGATGDEKDKRPTIAVKASPSFAFAPARIVLKADLKGGADDFEDYYCPSVEWDWGDGTISEAQEDCEPYTAGTSQIKRRYSAEHTYRQAGRFRVQFRLKRNDRTITASQTTVEIRPGIREGWN